MLRIAEQCFIFARNKMTSNPVSPPPSTGAADNSVAGSPVSPDQLLPPVEPPSARFILQLFVVPAVIVLFVVLLWLLVTTLATRGEQDPDKIVQALRSSNPARWQQAKELADMLRLEQRYPKLKHNAYLASQLAQMLGEEVDAGRTDDNSIEMRYFLCRVLGEFYVSDGLGVLLKAAREDVERDVRREAINALAVLQYSFHTMQPPQTLEDPDLVETLVQLANDQDDLIRAQTAYALGLFALQQDADGRLTDELEKLTDDLYADARYNAALALARRGNLRATEAVIEMFDPAAIAGSVAQENSPALQTFKRNTILKNALEAARALFEKNPHADLTELIGAVRRFVDTAPKEQVAGPIPEPLIKRGRRLLEQYGASR